MADGVTPVGVEEEGHALGQGSFTTTKYVGPGNKGHSYRVEESPRYLGAQVALTIL